MSCRVASGLPSRCAGANAPLPSALPIGTRRTRRILYRACAVGGRRSGSGRARPGPGRRRRSCTTAPQAPRDTRDPQDRPPLAGRRRRLAATAGQRPPPSRGPCRPGSASRYAHSALSYAASWQKPLSLSTLCSRSHGKNDPLESKDRWIPSRVLMGFNRILEIHLSLNFKGSFFTVVATVSQF